MTSPSRGYCGWFRNRWYLRSMLEFKTALYLEYLEDTFEHVSITYEDTSFETGVGTYKPDFFVHKNGNLTHIIEVKCHKNDSDFCKSTFYTYFKDLGIEYIAINEFHINMISKRMNILDSDLEKWKENSVANYSGENNPSFGLKRSDETRKLIGDKTKERFEDPEYKERWRDRVLESMSDPETRNKISLSRKEYIQRTNPLVDVCCFVCGTQFSVRKKKADPYKSGERGCSSGCTQRIGHQNGKYKSQKGCDNTNTMVNRLQGIVKKIPDSNHTVTDDIIQDLKKGGHIPKNSPASESCLLKYFSTTNREEILNYGKN